VSGDERCSIHDVYHCTICGYRWHNVDDDGNWTPIDGTGADV